MMGAAALLCVMSLLEAVAGSALDRQHHQDGRRCVALGQRRRRGGVRPHFYVGDMGGDGHVVFVLCGTPPTIQVRQLQHGRGVLQRGHRRVGTSMYMFSGVTTMYRMFYMDASAFNQDIGGWAVHSVTSMGTMFGTPRPLTRTSAGGWSGVTGHVLHVLHASAFDQDLGWCVDDDVDLD